MSQNALQRFQSSITRSTDAFNNEFFDALREQIRLYRTSENEDDWRIGLNVLNCCVISNSNSQQASEISWMQGRLMAKLGMIDEAKSALLSAVNTYPMIAGAWMSLGDLLFDSGVGGEECLMAYMQTLALKGSKGPKLIPRILSLIHRQQLNSLAEKCIDSQPSSVWIFWVPLLVKCLCSPAASPALILTAKSVLKKISVTFPQSVFYAIQSGMTLVDQEEIYAHMREHKKASDSGESIYNVMEFCRNVLVTGFANWDPEDINLAMTANALDELRRGRATVGDIKNRLPSGLIKGEPTEGALVKYLEKFYIPAQPSDHPIDYPLSSRINTTGLVSRISGSIEIIGNYTRFISVPHGSTLESMSSVLIAGIENTYQMVRDCTGETAAIWVPLITFIGSNGLRYKYTIRDSLSDETVGITSMVYAVLNSVFANHSQTRQRDIQFMALQRIPLSDNTVIREYVDNVNSYERIIGSSMSGSDDSMLISYVNATSSLDYYIRSRNFAKAIAANGMVDYLLGIEANRRSLNEVCVSQTSGAAYVIDSDLRKRVSSNDPVIPFRLPAYIQAFIGERNMVGLLPATMRAVADSIDAKPREVFELIELVSMLNEQESITQSMRRRLNYVVDDQSADGRAHLCERIINLINVACSKQ